MNSGSSTSNNGRRRNSALSIAAATASLLLSSAESAEAATSPYARTGTSSYDPDCTAQAGSIPHATPGTPSQPTPYTGFTVKTGTDCDQYVYCKNGQIDSWHMCTGGLKYNGAICDWATSMGPCVDGDSPGGGEDGSGGEGGGGEDALSQVMQQGAAATTPEPTPRPTPNPTDSQAASGGMNLSFGSLVEPSSSNNNNAGTFVASSYNGDVDDNPNNYYCGSSHKDAGDLCIPCPSGTMLECGKDYTHGCFINVWKCGSDGENGNGNSGGTSGSGMASSSSASAIGNALNQNVDAIVNGYQQQLSQNTPNSQPTYQQNQQAQQFNQPTYQATQMTSNTLTSNNVVPQPTPPPSLPPYTNAPFAPSPTGVNSKTVIGYYASWQWYDRNKFADPTNVDFSKYDRINYAFFQPNVAGDIFGTDEWADPQLLWGPYLYNAADHTNENRRCSWDGVDNGGGKRNKDKVLNCNHHDLSKGMLALAKQAGAEVMPSIGGWTLSDNFPAIAADAGRRSHFALQCKELVKYYGFDGIDIDWEYPGYADHSGTDADTINFTLLLQEIKNKLADLTDFTGKPYGLTAALPCGPDKIDDIQVGNVANILTELNLMTYDMHGAWDALTGTNAPLVDQGWGDKTKRWSVHGCVENYVDLGVPLNRMNVGLPFYGRSFAGATGMKQFHDGADDVNYHLDEGSPQYFNVVNELKRMHTFRHEKTATQYAVMQDGNGGVVSYDDARAICDKVGYANERGMNGFLIWEISGDMIDLGNNQMSTPLIDATNTKIANPNYDCSNLRDPEWALRDTVRRYAPDEPTSVDWSLYTAPLSAGSGNDFDGAGTAPRPAPLSPSSWNNPGSPSMNYVYVSSNNNAGGKSGSGSSNSGGKGGGKGDVNNDCPLDYTGYYATAECRGYVQCAGGAVLGASLPCVPGTLFDVTISACAWAAQVSCGS